MSRINRSTSDSRKPWIRKRIERESVILKDFEILGLEPPTRPNTRKFREQTQSLIEQGKARRIKAAESAPPIPF